MDEHKHKYLNIKVERADGSEIIFDLTDPISEPVFLLRGQDQYAAQVVGYYSDLLLAAGLDEQAAHAWEHATDMHHWPHKKKPD